MRPPPFFRQLARVASSRLAVATDCPKIGTMVPILRASTISGLVRLGARGQAPKRSNWTHFEHVDDFGRGSAQRE